MVLGFKNLKSQKVRILIFLVFKTKNLKSKVRILVFKLFYLFN